MLGLFFTLILISIPVGLVIAFSIHDDKSIWLAPIGAIALWLLIFPFYLMFAPPVKMYDVTIRAHYLDGHSAIIRKDSVYEDGLPRISSYRGSYYLDFSDMTIPAVIRFDYIEKKEYTKK